MLGIVIILFIPAFVSLLLLTFHKNKSNAKKVYLELKKQISKNEQRWDVITQQIVLDKKFIFFEELISFGVDAFLITKEKSAITVCKLNDRGQNKQISLMQYENLLSKLQGNRLFYTYSLDAYSIYYQFDTPQEKNILWLYHRSNIVLFP